MLGADDGILILFFYAMRIEWAWLKRKTTSQVFQRSSQHAHGNFYLFQQLTVSLTKKQSKIQGTDYSLGTDVRT